MVDFSNPDNLNPSIALQGNYSAPQPPGAAMGQLGQTVGVLNAKNQNKAFQANFAAKQAAGQIMAAAPDEATGIAQVKANPQIMSFAPEVVQQYAALQQAGLQTEAGKQALSEAGSKSVMNAVLAGSANPGELEQNLNTVASGFSSPSAKAAAQKTTQAIMNSVNAPVYQADGTTAPPTPAIQQQRIRAMGLAAGLSSDQIQNAYGKIDNVNLGDRVQQVLQPPVGSANLPQNLGQGQQVGFGPQNTTVGNDVVRVPGAPGALPPAGVVPLPAPGQDSAPPPQGSVPPPLSPPQIRNALGAGGAPPPSVGQSGGNPITAPLQVPPSAAGQGPAPAPVSGPTITPATGVVSLLQQHDPAELTQFVPKPLPGQTAISAITGQQTSIPNAVASAARSKQFAEVDTPQYQTAQNIISKSQQIDQAYTALAQAPGGTSWFTTPGAGGEGRLEAAKLLTTIQGALGIKQSVPADNIALSEELQKLTKQSAFDTARTLGGHEGSQVLQEASGANPSLNNTIMGGKLVNAAIQAAAQRTIDKYEFAQNQYLPATGTLQGVDEAFNKLYPVEKYSSMALATQGLDKNGQFQSPQALATALQKGFITPEVAKSIAAKLDAQATVKPQE